MAIGHVLPINQHKSRSSQQTAPTKSSRSGVVCDHEQLTLEVCIADRFRLRFMWDRDGRGVVCVREIREGEMCAACVCVIVCAHVSICVRREDVICVCEREKGRRNVWGVCECVCVCERERERECVCARV
jgi:hypothetical protein